VGLTWEQAGQHGVHGDMESDFSQTGIRIDDNGCLHHQRAPRPSIMSESHGKRYGTVSIDDQRGMSGLEFIQRMIDGVLPTNTMANTLGYDITEVSNGRVAVTAKPNAAHLNPAGTVHGGLAATLLDSCMGLAIQSTLEKGIGQTTVEFKISLVRPITPETGLITAEGIVLNRGRRIGTAEGRITDHTGRLLAHGTTTCLIFQNEVATSGG
jgi:uncharacterized protein (TIGR00369 family)